MRNGFDSQVKQHKNKYSKCSGALLPLRFNLLFICHWREECEVKLSAIFDISIEIMTFSSGFHFIHLFVVKVKIFLFFKFAIEEYNLNKNNSYVNANI